MSNKEYGQGDLRVSESKHYQDRGYQIFRGMLPPDLVNAVADRARQLVSYGGNVIRQNGTFSAHDFFPGTQLIRNSPANMHLPLPGEQAPLSTALRDLLSSQALAECLKKLDGAQHYNVHQTIVFYAGQTTEMHIDSWSVDTAPHGFAHTLWIPLQDIDPNSGSVAVVPWPRGKVVTEKELGLPASGDNTERYDSDNGTVSPKRPARVTWRLDHQCRQQTSPSAGLTPNGAGLRRTPVGNITAVGRRSALMRSCRFRKFGRNYSSPLSAEMSSDAPCVRIACAAAHCL